MSSICLAALLSGAILGLMYKAFALVPASLAMIGLAVVVETASEHGPALTGFACALSVVLLQAGYLAASLLIEQRLRFTKQWRIRRGGLRNRAI